MCLRKLIVRDPNRIEEILYFLQQHWEKDPDLRFFQLIYILQAKLSQERGGAGKIEGSAQAGESPGVGYDFFNMEDTEVLSWLQRCL